MSPSLLIVTVTATEANLENCYSRLIDFDQQGWVEQEDGGQVELAVHFADEEEAERCRKAFPGAVLTRVEERNWAEEWQSQWQPILVGERFFLAPSWSKEPAPAGRIRLEMRPGLVFGGGDHPTTQLCLELLESAVRPSDQMGDIGCGTAILAQAALALGAMAAIGCDLDPTAIDAAVESGVPVFEGSVDAIRTDSLDLLCANLPTGVLMTLLPEFARVLVPGGAAVVSGYLSEQREMLISEAVTNRFRIGAQRSRDGWDACVIVTEPR